MDCPALGYLRHVAPTVLMLCSARSFRCSALPPQPLTLGAPLRRSDIQPPPRSTLPGAQIILRSAAPGTHRLRRSAFPGDVQSFWPAAHNTRQSTALLPPVTSMAFTRPVPLAFEYSGALPPHHLHWCSRRVTNDPTSARLPRPPPTVHLCFSDASALALPGVSPSQASTLGGSVFSSVRPTPALGRSESSALGLSGTQSLRRSAGPHPCQSSTSLLSMILNIARL